MQQNPKTKKFTHNRMKACIERNEGDDKENRVIHGDFRNKKLSVQLPSRCMESHETDPQKSIFNEQISVTLNTSNTRANAFEKDYVSLDIKTLTHLLSKQKNNPMPLKEILSDQMNDIKSFEVKMLVSRMLDRLQMQEGRHMSSMTSEKQDLQIEMTETRIKPYLQKEIEELQANHLKLAQEIQFIQAVKASPMQQKMQLLNSMKEQYASQLSELSQYESD